MDHPADSHPTGCAVEARLVLGGLDEASASAANDEFDMDRNATDANIVLGYDWLRVHNLSIRDRPGLPVR
jgi:hypothetical protein